MHSRTRWQVALGCLLLGGVGAQAATIAIQSVSLSPAQVGLYQPLTVSFNLSKTYGNPYDPDAVDVEFEFTGPSGIARLIPGYWTDGSPAWQAKIVPLEAGAHSCRIVVNDSVGDSGTYSLAFTAVSSADRGFIRVNPRNGRYLRFDSGGPYLPVGHDVCWFGDDPNFNVWMTNMAQAGENWTRYWISSHAGQDIEWGGGTNYQLGRYSQSNARLIDRMMEAVRTRGIYVQFCTDSFNGWNQTLFPTWNENPYNVANGGMCSRPNDYFTNSDAARYAKRRFRYFVARWAWNPAILCWEFFNEVDAIGGGGATFWGHETEIAAWHQQMAQYIRSIDPFQHLRTTSFADDGPRSSYAIFWQLPEMDLVQCHQYSIIYPQEMVSLVQQVRQFNKPVILGETSANGTDASQLDTNGQSLHDIIWALAVDESGGMSWWWDSYIQAKNLYYRFKPLVAFLAGEDWAPQQLAPVSYSRLSGPSTAEVYGSGGPHNAYLYIRNWQAAVSGMRIKLAQVTTPCSYTVEYWDTNNQAPFRTDTVAGSTGGLTLDLPDFARDLGIKARPQVPSLQVAPAALTATAYVGQDAAPSSFTITSVGSGTVNYTITSGAGWLSATPASGSVAGETDTIAVNLASHQLLPGVYHGTLTVSDDSGLSPSASVSVSLTVMALPGDFDLDGDVDQQDFGHLQACLAGSGISAAPGCADADMDHNGDVAQEDSVIFQGCMSGANVPANPSCAN